MTTEMTNEQKKARLETIETELKTLTSKIDDLEKEKKDLMKSLKSAIRKELNVTAKLYGLQVINKTKKSKDIEADTEEEAPTEE